MNYYSFRLAQPFSYLDKLTGLILPFMVLVLFISTPIFFSVPPWKISGFVPGQYALTYIHKQVNFLKIHVHVLKYLPLW